MKPIKIELQIGFHLILCIGYGLQSQSNSKTITQCNRMQWAIGIARIGASVLFNYVSFVIYEFWLLCFNSKQQHCIQSLFIIAIRKSFAHWCRMKQNTNKKDSKKSRKKENKKWVKRRRETDCCWLLIEWWVCVSIVDSNICFVFTFSSWLCPVADSEQSWGAASEINIQKMQENDMKWNKNGISRRAW